MRGRIFTITSTQSAAFTRKAPIDVYSASRKRETIMKAFIADRYKSKGGERIGEMPVPELRENDV